MISIEATLDRHAARAALAILAHPGSLWFDAATSERLVLIEDRGAADASDVEWRLLSACHEAVLRAERGTA